MQLHISWKIILIKYCHRISNKKHLFIMTSFPNLHYEFKNKKENKLQKFLTQICNFINYIDFEKQLVTYNSWIPLWSSFAIRSLGLVQYMSKIRNTNSKGFFSTVETFYFMICTLCKNIVGYLWINFFR